MLTDGLDVLNLDLGPIYPQGIFLAHTGGSTCCSVKGVRWDEIAGALDLRIDTSYWDPRIPCEPLEDVVRFEETRSGGVQGGASVATDGSLSAAAGDLYLAAVSTRPPADVAGVQGLGLTWTLVRSQCSGRDQTAIEAWMAQGDPVADGAVTAELLSAPTSSVITVNRFSNVAGDPLGEVLSGNTNGPEGPCSGGIDDASYSFNVDTTVEGAFVFGAVTMRNRTHTPVAGYRERSETSIGTGGAVASVATLDMQVWAPQPTALSGTFSGDTDWAVIGFEILPGGTAPPPAPCPWDLDRDGSVAVTDLLGLLAQWGTTPVALRTSTSTAPSASPICCRSCRAGARVRSAGHLGPRQRNASGPRTGTRSPAAPHLAPRQAPAHPAPAPAGCPVSRAVSFRPASVLSSR